MRSLEDPLGPKVRERVKEAARLSPHSLGPRIEGLVHVGRPEGGGEDQWSERWGQRRRNEAPPPTGVCARIDDQRELKFLGLEAGATSSPEDRLWGVGVRWFQPIVSVFKRLWVPVKLLLLTSGMMPLAEGAL